MFPKCINQPTVGITGVTNVTLRFNCCFPVEAVKGKIRISQSKELVPRAFNQCPLIRHIKQIEDTLTN